MGKNEDDVQTDLSSQSSHALPPGKLTGDSTRIASFLRHLHHDPRHAVCRCFLFFAHGSLLPGFRRSSHSKILPLTSDILLPKFLFYSEILMDSLEVVEA